MSDRLKARIIHTHDIEENWNKCVDFVPEKSEIIVYDIDDQHPYPRFKIGDGVTPVVNLKFSIDAVIEEPIEFKDGIGYIDSGRIR